VQTVCRYPGVDAARRTIHRADALWENSFVKASYDSGLDNEDLAPVPLAKRSWGLCNYASLWVAMSVCIPTYMLASGLIAGGMNWWQAVGTILLGNLIALAPMLLNAHAGTKYGIPFPALVRASFGVRGANLPAVLRALVAWRVRPLVHGQLQRICGY
jgi:NCS1 family nucleobase:cation symporter-1